MNTEAQTRAETTLSEYDFIVCIDQSGSMGDPVKANNPGGANRWSAAKESIVSFARDIEKIDSDGIDVVFFGNDKAEVVRGGTAQVIADAFDQRNPRGGTPLHTALKEALKLKKGKKLFVLVATDGRPDDEQAVAQVIKAQSNSQQSDEECTFLFVQVGDDGHATKYLDDLDNHLSGAKYDIVNALTIEAANKFNSTAEMVIHAINN